MVTEPCIIYCHKRCCYIQYIIGAYRQCNYGNQADPVINISCTSFLCKVSFQCMHYHADALPACNNKISFNKRFIHNMLFSIKNTGNSKSSNPYRTDPAICNFKTFHTLYFNISENIESLLLNKSRKKRLSFP